MLPSKLQSGQNFKTQSVKKINQIIDYLKSQRIVGDNKTIKVSQLTSAVSISSINNPVSKGSGGSGGGSVRPFQMNIASLQSGQKILTISEGKIYINGQQGDRIYFHYDNIEQGKYLQLPSQTGNYDVIGYINYTPQGNDTGFQDAGVVWNYGTVYMPEGTTADCTKSAGFYSFLIGVIEVSEDDQGNLVYNVTAQKAHSDFSLYSGDLKQPFKIWLSMSELPEDGQLVDQLNCDVINISMGRCVVSDKYFQTVQFSEDIEISENNQTDLYCLNFTKQGSGVIDKVSFEQWQWFNEQDSSYWLPIGFIAQSNVCGMQVYQMFSGTFTYSVSDKVLLNELDITAGHLQDKLKYNIITEQSLQQGDNKEKAEYFASGKGYITGVTRNLNKDQQDENGNPLPANLQDQLYWDYTSIQDYEKANLQVMVNDKDQLKWMNRSDLGLGQLDVQGSAAQFFEFVLDKKQQEDKDGNITSQTKEKKTLLRYKPEYVQDTDAFKDEEFYFLTQNQSKMQKLTFGKDDFAVDGVMLWDYIQGQPYPWVAPEATQDVNLYCLTGVYGDQINWTPFENKVLQVQGSFGDIFQIVNDEQDTTKKYIRVIDEFLEEKGDMPFRFLNLDENGELKLTTFSDQQVNQSLIMWQAGKINMPFLLSPPVNEDKENITYILSGDEQALNWVNIYDYCGKVKVSEQDSTADFLGNKFCSEDQTVTIGIVAEDGYQMVDLSAPFVKVAQTDETAGYLSEKLESDESVIQALTLEADQDCTVVQLKLVPQGNGILVYQNGILTPLPAPSKPSVLTFDGTNFAWQQYSDCENACQAEETQEQ